MSMKLYELDHVNGYHTLEFTQKLLKGKQQATNTEPRCEKTGLRGFQPGGTYRAVQPQKMARGLKYRI